MLLIVVSESFCKKSRLLKKQDFLGLRSNPIKIISGDVLIFYKKHDFENKISRVGVSVSKKNGNSVMRNKYKRIIREYFRKSNLRHFGIDILFVIRKNKQDKRLFSTNTLLDSLRTIECKCKQSLTHL